MPILSYEITDSDSSIDESRTRTATRAYLVIATEDMEAFAVRVAFPIGIHTAHPTDAGQYATKVDVKLSHRTKGHYPHPDLGSTAVLVWALTVSYGPWNPLNSFDENPLDQPPRFRLEPQTVERPIDVDADGNPVVNSAGDPFDPGPVEEVTQYILTVLRNEKDIDLNALMLLSGRSRINNAEWNGFPEKTVKSLPIKIPERLFYQGNPDVVGDGFLYFPMEYSFHINFDTWTVKLINQGFGELATASGVTKRRAILDSSGQPATTPVLLDSSGHPLAQPIDHTNVVILPFEVYTAIDFTIFDLDGLFT
jgi:hypothetical protein